MTSRSGRNASIGLRSALRLVAVGGAVLALGGVLLAGEPARAGDDFERGFKTELGRIAAHEAVSIGTHILGGIFHPGHRAYYARRHVPYDPYFRYGHRTRHYAPKHHYVEKHHYRRKHHHEHRHKHHHEHHHYHHQGDSYYSGKVHPSGYCRYRH